MELISLIVLVLTIVIAFAFKVNSGLVAIVSSLLFARISGISDAALMKMFDNKMFGQMFALSAGAVLFGGLLAVTGLYSWF